MSRPSQKRDGSPVKAGPKKIFGPIVKNHNGIVISGIRKSSEKKQNGYEMPETKLVHVVPKGKYLKALLTKVDELERKSATNSDPFMFNRMRTHVRHGIYTFS